MEAIRKRLWRNSEASQPPKKKRKHTLSKKALVPRRANIKIAHQAPNQTIQSKLVLDNRPRVTYHPFEATKMFGGGLEIGFLLFIAFLLFGPKKLPEIARTLGKGMAELRRASNELKHSLEEEIRNLDRLPEASTPAPKYGDYHSESSANEPGSQS